MLISKCGKIGKEDKSMAKGIGALPEVLKAGTNEIKR